MVLAVLTACGWAAEPGELWLRIEDTDGQDRVLLNLPVSELKEPGSPAFLHTPAGDVDLRAEAKGLRIGDERRWTGADGEVVALSSTAPSPAPATLLAVGIGGPKGGGLEATFPLEPSNLGQVNARTSDLDLSLDGLDLTLDDDACAQLRRSPPVLLAEIVGPNGNGLRVRTR